MSKDKVIIFVGVGALALGELFFSIQYFNEERYGQCATSVIASFMMFHILLTVLKNGMKPWRVLWAFYIVAGMYASKAIVYLTEAHWVAAAFTLLTTYYWVGIARKIVEAKRHLQAEGEE